MREAYRRWRRASTLRTPSRSGAVSRLQQAGEHLVREQPAALCEAQPVAGRLEQAGLEAPRQPGCRRWPARDAVVQAQAEDEPLGLGALVVDLVRAAGRQPAAARAPRATGRTPRRSSGEPGRRMRARPDRRPRTAGAASTRGCGGTRARASPSSRSRSGGSPPRRGGPRRARTARPRGPRPARRERARAIAARRGVTGRWSPPSASSSVSAYSERWSGSSARAASSVAAHDRTVWPGASYRRSTFTEAIPAARASLTAAATSSGECRRPSARSSAAVEALRPERDPRDADVPPGSRVAALVGAGVRLERHLGARLDPERAADGGEQPRRPRRGRAATASRRRDRTRPASRPGRARSRISAASASRYSARRFSGPRAAFPGSTTKSQYGQRATQNGTWT